MSAGESRATIYIRGNGNACEPGNAAVGDDLHRTHRAFTEDQQRPLLCLDHTGLLYKVSFSDTFENAECRRNCEVA